MRDLGGAARGDRTMLDALWPAAEVFAKGGENGQSCAQLPSRHVIALGGRSSYLGALGRPDPGAVAVQFDWKPFR